MLANYGFYQHSLHKQDKFKFFYYRLQDLEKQGIRGIILIDGVWSPEYSDDAFEVEEKYIN
ncbi:MAG: hypothetical protein GY787_33870 [Alteromonadales bacterium]|nr:hypothetical protein [Alteromonadales bacterium]